MVAADPVVDPRASQRKAAEDVVDRLIEKNSLSVGHSIVLRYMFVEHLGDLGFFSAWAAARSLLDSEGREVEGDYYEARARSVGFFMEHAEMEWREPLKRRFYEAIRDARSMIRRYSVYGLAAEHETYLTMAHMICREPGRRHLWGILMGQTEKEEL